MKINIKFLDKDFEVNREINKNIYRGLRSDADDQKQDDVIKFYLSNRDKFFSNELISFLNSTGIEWAKENEIFHYRVDDNLTIIEGWYDIVGRVLSKEEVASYLENDLFTTNVFFNNDTRHAIYPEFASHETFRFSFSIVLEKEILG